jgi:DNA-binding MarR family transcriptional regulator
MAWPNHSIAEDRLPSLTSIFVSDAPNDDAVNVLSAVLGSSPRCMSSVEADGWIGEGRTADLMQIELPHWPNSDIEVLVQRADAYGARINMPVLVVGPIETLDLMVSTANNMTSHWLCAPSTEDRLAETALILASTGSAFHDVAGDIDSLRLRRLADEVSRIARALSSLSSTERPLEGFAQNALAEARPSFRGEPVELSLGGTAPTAEEVRQVLRLRRLRERHFDPALFADPAWDMLLDLMAARLEETQVAVSSLCIAASVPPTTALRWIKTMTDHRIFERCADPDDGRRIFIRLSDSAMNGMARYFESAKKIGGLMI